MQPVLSICIPTYNNAELLKGLLSSLASQQIEFKNNEFEVVVSDNCSPDHTKDVALSFANQMPLIYHRNEENVGAAKNIFVCTNKLAQGNFCWVIGDDDRIQKGGIKKIIDTIQNNPDIDYIYVNYAWEKFEYDLTDDVEGKKIDKEKIYGLGNKNFKERKIEIWQQLLIEDMNCLTPIYGSVFRRTKWIECSEDISIGKPFSNLSSTYPQSIVLGKMMVNKPAYAIGFPWIYRDSKAGFGWAEHLPVAILLRFHDLLDHLLSVGVENKYIINHRKRMLKISDEALAKQINSKSLPGLEEFSLIRFLLKYFFFIETWSALIGALDKITISQAFRKYLFLSVLSLFVKPVMFIKRKI